MKKNANTFIEGTKGFEIYHEVRPQNDDLIVVKHTPGSFYETNLDELLAQYGIKNLVVTGMQTQKCCDTTTREASARNYHCFFITDAVETFDLTGIDGHVIDRDKISESVFATLSHGFASVISFKDLKEMF